MDAAESVSELVLAIATVIALLIAAWQLRANARAAGQTHAREAWMMYLEAGLQNPELGGDRVAMNYFKMKNTKELVEGESINSERYLWFLSIMLEACESLLEYFPTKGWRKTIKFNVRLHKDAIRESWGGESDFYSKDLCALVREVLNEESSLPPEESTEAIVGAQS